MNFLNSPALSNSEIVWINLLRRPEFPSPFAGRMPEGVSGQHLLRWGIILIDNNKHLKRGTKANHHQ